MRLRGGASATARDTQDAGAADPGVRVYGEEQEDTPPEGEEAQAPLAAREPDQPTEEERRHHELTHMPFRSWCSHCVRGRQDSLPHRPSPTTALAVPEVAMDYCFLGRAGSPSSATVLIMKDRESRSILASVVQSKGRGLDETVTQAAANIRRLGHYGRVILKTDGEPAIMDLRRGVAEKLQCVVPMERPAPYEPQINGSVENGVKQFKGLLRTLSLALEARVGVEVPVSHPLTSWLVDHTAELLTKYTISHDGRTPLERLTGKVPHRQLRVRRTGNGAHSNGGRSDLAPGGLVRARRRKAKGCQHGCALGTRHLVRPAVGHQRPPRGS